MSKKEMKRLTRDDTEHKVEYYRADEVDALPAEQPAQKRPQNCGTGYCSCIECVMEPVNQFDDIDVVDMPAQQEPLFKRLIEGIPGLAEELKALDAAQPEQEPVAWINPDEQNARKAFHWVESEEFTSAVYATPPKEKNT